MKIVILGAGALGSIIGGHLARAGEEVMVIARGPRAAFVQQHGISLTGLANFTVPVQVTTNPQEVRAADVLIVAVKTADTEAALASVRHVQVGSALSIQNGVLKDEQLAHTFGWDKTLGAAAIISGEVTANGSVRFTSTTTWRLANCRRARRGESRTWLMPCSGLASMLRQQRRFRPLNGPNTLCS